MTFSPREPTETEIALTDEVMKMERQIRNSTRDKIITLCGSTRYKPLFEFIERELTFRGWLVFSIGGTFTRFEPKKIADRILRHEPKICRVHKRKIAHSRAIYVIDGFEGYYGAHTSSEIRYAKRHKKQVYRFSADSLGLKTQYSKLLRKGLVCDHLEVGKQLQKHLERPK